MHQRYLILVTSFVFAMLLFTPQRFVKAAATTSPDNVIIEKVKEAKTLLDQTDLGYAVYTVQSSSKNKSYVRMLKRDVAVVGLDLKTNALKEFAFEERLPMSARARPNQKAPQVIAADNACELVWRGGSRWGFNRNLMLGCDGKNYTIVGIKMPYPTGTAARGILLDSYVPYSPELHTNEMVQVGKDYLQKIIEQASNQLSQSDVKSRAFPDRKINQIVEPDFVMSLVLNEHMDPGEFFASLKKGTFPKLVEKILVTIGLNQERAMRWSMSKTGACCLTQFMPRTYKLVAMRYPEADLDPATLRGRQEHINAIKASIVLFDSDISSGWKTKTKETCFSSMDMLEKCLAASYNAGPGTLNKVVRGLGINWDSGGVRDRWTPRLKRETVYYLQKLASIKNYLVGFEKPATAQ